MNVSLDVAQAHLAKALAAGNPKGVQRALAQGASPHTYFPIDPKDALCANYDSALTLLFPRRLQWETHALPERIACLEALIGAGLDPQVPIFMSSTGPQFFSDSLLHPHAQQAATLAWLRQPHPSPLVRERLAPMALVQAYLHGDLDTLGLDHPLAALTPPIAQWPAPLETTSPKGANTWHNQGQAHWDSLLSQLFWPWAWHPHRDPERNALLLAKVEDLPGATTTAQMAWGGNPTPGRCPDTAAQAATRLAVGKTWAAALATTPHFSLKQSLTRRCTVLGQAWPLAAACAAGACLPTDEDMQDLIRQMAQVGGRLNRVSWSSTMRGCAESLAVESEANEAALLTLLGSRDPRAVLGDPLADDLTFHPQPATVRALVRWLDTHPHGPFTELANACLARYLSDSAPLTRVNAEEGALVQRTVQTLCQNDTGRLLTVLEAVDWRHGEGKTHIPLWDRAPPSPLNAWAAQVRAGQLDHALPAGREDRRPRI